MMNPTSEILRNKAAPLREKLEALRSGARQHILIVGLSYMVITTALFFLLSFSIDYWTLDLERSTRTILLGAAAAVLLGVAVRWLLLPLRITLSDDDLALAVERENPELKESLINAVQFSRYRFDARHQVSTDLMEAVEDQAREATSRLDFRGTLDSSRLRRRATLGVLCILTLGILAFRFPDEASLWFQRAILLSEAPWPSKTEFVLHGFDESRTAWVAKGRDYSVVAQAKGVIPRRVVLRYRYGEGRRQKAVMHGLGRSEFKHDFQRVLEPIEFYLVGGDRRTAPYTIHVVDRPRVKNLVLTGIPPAYTNKSTIVVEGGQEARLPAGSTLKIAGEATKSIVEAKVIFGEQEHIAELTGDRNFLLQLEPEESAALEIILRDDRLEDDRPVRLHVRLIKDRPPRLKLRLSGIGDMVTPQAVIPMSVHITDDYGISSADLRWRLSSADAHSSIPLDGIEKGMRVTDPPIAYRWELSTHHPPPGEFLTFLVEALDLDDVAGPNLGSSETYTLKVVTIQEFSVEMIRRQEEQRRELKRLIEREEKDRDSLTTLGADPEDARTGRERALEGLERSQRLASRQTEGIGDRMEQILAEMLNNRVAELRHARRIRSRVIHPLRDISTGAIQDLADHLGALEAPSADTILKTAQSYDRIISQLNRILSYMDRIEKFTEVVAILRTIIESHSAATKETEKAYKKKIEDIFKEF